MMVSFKFSETVCKRLRMMLFLYFHASIDNHCGRFMVYTFKFIIHKAMSQCEITLKNEGVINIFDQN